MSNENKRSVFVLLLSILFIFIFFDKGLSGNNNNLQKVNEPITIVGTHEDTIRKSLTYSELDLQKFFSIRSASFSKPLSFNNSIFERGFWSIGSTYNQLKFSKTRFKENVDFVISTFLQELSFYESHFEKNIQFVQVGANTIDFSYSSLSGSLNIELTGIKKLILLNTLFSDSSEVRFWKSSITDSLIIGIIPSLSREPIKKIQNYNLLWATFGADTKIVLNGPVRIKLQLERLKYLTINNELDYFDKKYIIDEVKRLNYADPVFTRERFELDFIFAKSTLYQKISNTYEEYSLFSITRLANFIYYTTMGLGYRPFRIIPWLIIILLGFSVWLWLRIPSQINKYINKAEKKKQPELDNENKFTTFINCFYVTAGLFFGIRLKQDVLTFFKPNERWRIIVIWAIGLLMYFYFIYFAKSGSILNSIKGLITG